MEGTSKCSRDKSVYKLNHPEGDTQQGRTLLLDEGVTYDDLPEPSLPRCCALATGKQ